uniref:AGC-kinase C-terminal domain-containing protein n=1 Tax=Cynoglossus semilaevis TaxID=244447 RepID=A0A3P8WP52_CYNSE
YSSFSLALILLCSLTLCCRSRRDTCNFDKEFTKMAVDLTPTDKLVIMNLDQDDFLGFSFTNSEYEAPAN